VTVDDADILYVKKMNFSGVNRQMFLGLVGKPRNIRTPPWLRN
jgi:hypothetical protein